MRADNSTFISSCANPECSNRIEITYGRYPGGINDSEEIIYECDLCGHQDSSIIKNSETLHLKGAKKISSKYLD